MATAQNKVTSYDVLKTVIVLLMIVDHIGYFFAPEWDWLRALGRSCVPAWFFLAGYSARKGRFDYALWTGALLMIIWTAIYQQKPFPLNILLSLVFIKYLVPRMEFIQRSPVMFITMFLFLAVLNLAVYDVLEYGTMGIMLGLWGYWIAHDKEEGMQNLATTWGTASILYYILHQWIYFEFDLGNGIFMSWAVAVIYFTLKGFTVIPVNGGKTNGLLKFCGRQTLLIYIAHFLIFAVIAKEL